MPLITLLFLAHAAGLWLGFAQRPGWAGMLVVVLVVGAWRRRQRVLGIAAVVVVHALLVANSAVAAADRCRAQVLRDGQVQLILLTPLAPGRSAAAHTVGSCRVRVHVNARDTAPTGAQLQVTGTFRRAGTGLAVRRASIVVVRPPGPLARSRARVSARIDQIFESDAPLVRALVLAEQYDLSQELRTRWADAGIIHMVSVSGLHVSIIAGGLILLLGATPLGRARGEVAAVLVLALYIAWIGAPPPAVRSAGMSALVILSRQLQRPTSPWAVWAGASAFSLLEPRVVLDLGWQLSVTGMAGLMASARWTRPWPTLNAWARTVIEGVVATGVATLATAPIIAWTFGRLSLAALVTNLAAAPLFNIAQPLLFVAVLMAWVPMWLGGIVFDACRGALALIEGVAIVGARLPFAVVAVAPEALVAGCLTVVAAATVVAGATGRWRASATVALTALVVAAFAPHLPRGNGQLELHLIDVGQGDAIALRTPRGRWILVDAGPSWRGGDAGARTVAPYLRRFGGDVVHLLVTHPHADHHGGVRGLLPLAIDTLWESGDALPTGFAALLAEAAASGTVVRQAVAGDSVSLDGVLVRVLSPTPVWRDAEEDPNEGSLVLRVEYGRQRWLLMGDAETGTEEWLLAHRQDALASNLLKVGHHGSRTSTTPAFLAAVRPAVALVSVGRDNDYGHPDDDVLRSLDAQGVRVLRTDDDGTIIVRTDGEALEVRAGRTRWQCCDGSRGR